MRLTAEQRAALFRGEHPRITYPRNPPPVGHVERISSRLKVTVIDRVRTKKGDWRIDYLVSDERPNLLRRVPPADPVPAQGELDDDAKERAAIESAYTHSENEAVPGDPGEAPPREFVEREATKGRSRHAERRRLERAEQCARQDARDVGRHLAELAVRMARIGLDPAPLLLEFEKRIREEQRNLRS